MSDKVYVRSKTKEQISGFEVEIGNIEISPWRMNSESGTSRDHPKCRVQD